MGEYTGDWAYYTTDALGSVRQIVDSTGTVQYYQSYEPYGDVLASAGQGGSNYGYANEWTSQGLIYLRARYYDSSIARFLTRDTWVVMRWTPGSGSPALYVDSSKTERSPEVGHFLSWTLMQLFSCLDFSLIQSKG